MNKRITDLVLYKNWKIFDTCYDDASNIENRAKQKYELVKVYRVASDLPHKKMFVVVVKNEKNN